MKDFGLRKNFEKFDWNDGFEHQGGYEALTQKHMTLGFTASTWNDIVLILRSLLYEMHLGWDDGFCEYDSCYTSFMKPFLAKQFNGVAENLKIVSNCVFRWEYDKSYEGYLGRAYVRGYSETPEADILYGDYILELVRKLNKAIDFWKGEADVTDLAGVLNLKALSESVLNIAKTLDFRIRESFRATSKAYINFFESFTLGGVAINNSYYFARLNRRYAGSTFISKLDSRMRYEAELILELLYRNMETITYLNMKSNARLRCADISNLSVSLNHFMVQYGRMSYPTLVLMKESVKGAESRPVGNLSFHEALYVAVNHIEDVISTDAKLVAKYKMPLRGFGQGVIDAYGLMVNTLKSDMIGLMQLRAVIQKARMTSHIVRRLNAPLSLKALFDRHTMVRGRVVTMDDLERCETNLFGIMTLCHRFLANVLSEISSTIVGNLTENEAYPMEIDEKLDVIHENSEIILRQMVYTGIRFLEKARHSAEMNMDEALPFGSQRFLDDSFGFRAKITSMTSDESMEVNEGFGMISRSLLTIIRFDIYPAIDNVFSSMADARIVNAPPALMDAEHRESVSTQDKFEIYDSRNSIRIDVLAFLDDFEASITNRKPAMMKSISVMNSDMIADVTFSPLSWLNPILDGSEIYIRQAYDADVTEGIMKID